MKKLYLFLFAVLLTASSFSQIGPSWWQYLPSDWRTNTYVRDTIMITNVADDFVGGYDVLATLWDDVVADVVEINSKTGGPDADGAADVDAKAKLFWDANNLYILYKVVDQEVDTAKDFLEIHTAPYGCYYNPDRTIFPHGYPPWANVSPDPSDYEFGGTIIPGLEYVAMSKMGSWTEAGAYKMEIKLKTKEDFYPSAITYSLVGPAKDTLGDVSSGAPDSPLTTVYEAAADGYLMLIIEPWAVMKGMVPEEGVFESMSVAVKINDYDSDNADGDDEDTNPDIAQYWGGTTDNSAYWAIAYYGAVGKFFDKDIPSCGLPSGISNFVTSIDVTSEGGVTDVTDTLQTLQLTAAILPANADVQFVQWSVSPDSAVIDGAGMLSGFKPGTYTVTAKATALDGSGVTGTLDINVAILPTNLDTRTAPKFTAYPSPARDMLTITNTQKVTRVDVINIVGQPVASFSNKGLGTMKLNVSDLRQGIYLLNIKTPEGTATIRFTKQ
jgi:hypothetical protein